MIVRDTNDSKANGSFREKKGAWSSARFLLNSDQLGFTLTQTTIAAGTRQTYEYKNHKEANLIIEGPGNVTDETTNKVYELKPGSMYTLDKHERHTVEAHTDMRLVCGGHRGGHRGQGSFTIFNSRSICLNCRGI